MSCSARFLSLLAGSSSRDIRAEGAYTLKRDRIFRR